jgi:hypothetical protein
VPKTRDPFNASLDRLRMALLAGPGLSSADRRVALLMVESVNRDIFEKSGTLETWPAEETIAVSLNLDAASVRRARTHLRTAGVVTYSNSGGKRKTAHYWFKREWIDAALADLDERLSALKEDRERRADNPRNSAPLSDDETRATLRPLDDTERGAFQDAKGRILEPKGAHFASQRGANLRPNLPDDLPEDSPEDLPDVSTDGAAALKGAAKKGNGHDRRASPGRRRIYSPAFEEFWTQYPKAGQVAKQKTSKKFAAIVASGEATLDEIMAGLAVYGASRKVADGYICHTMTWLNEQRWTVTETPAATRAGGKPGALDALRRMEGEDQ